MQYRLATPDDQEQINKLADAGGIPHPILALCFVAVEDDGTIRGFVNGGWASYIESIGTDHPMVGATLFAMIEGALRASKATPIVAGITNPDAARMLERLGYKKSGSTQFYVKG